MIAADTPSVAESPANEVDPQQTGPEATTVENGPIGQNQVWFRPRRNRGIRVLNYKRYKYVIEFTFPLVTYVSKLRVTVRVSVFF